MIRPRIALAALLVVCSPLVAGCGENENNTFKEDYNEAVGPLSTTNTDLTGSIEGTPDQSNAVIAEEFSDLADKTAQARDNLSALDPPDDAKEDLDKLVASMGRGVEDLRAVARAAEDADPAAGRQAKQDLVASAQQIQKAETALQEAVDG